VPQEQPVLRAEVTELGVVEPRGESLSPTDRFHLFWLSEAKPAVLLMEDPLMAAKRIRIIGIRARVHWCLRCLLLQLVQQATP
jgi:hypothetical protein